MRFFWTGTQPSPVSKWLRLWSSPATSWWGLGNVLVILDECVDRRLAPSIVGHRVTTVPNQGWAGLQNGELLSRVAEGFEVFVTIDKSLPSQQNLERYDVAIVVLDAVTNRLADLEPLIPALLEALPKLRPRELVVLGSV